VPRIFLSGISFRLDAQANFQATFSEREKDKMTSEVTSTAGWKQLYQSALLETDAAKLPGRIADAHTAIYDRMQELLSRPSCGEHLALMTALRFLRILAKETSEECKTA
jgi:hypothetical protein